MAAKYLDADTPVTQNRVEYIFKQGTEIEYYPNGIVKRGTLAREVLTQLRGFPAKFTAGNVIDFNEKGEVVDLHSVKMTKSGKALIFTVFGSLEVSATVKLEEAINEQIRKGEVFLILDLSNTHYLSSSGIRVFLATLKQVKDLKGHLILAALSSEVEKILKTVDLGNVFEFTKTVEEAVQIVNNG